MAKDSDTFLHALDRLSTSLVLERGRVGLMQRWLRDHAGRLEDLSGRIDGSLARIDTLLRRDVV